MRITRRGLFAAGVTGLGLTTVGVGGVRLVDAGLLPGQGPVNELLGRCDVPAPAAPGLAGTIVDGSFESVHRRGRVDYRLAYPPGFGPGSRLPVCLVLHGYGADARMAIEAGAYDRYLAAFVATGGAPAIWRSYDEARKVSPGAFDSASQWANHDVFARARELTGLRVRIDCGEHDSFAPAVRALRARLPDPGVVHVTPGCHNGDFWRYAAPAQLRFIGDAIAH